MDGHLILGKLVDYLTGTVLPDTHDERYRQKIARQLVEVLAFEKSDVTGRHELIVTAGDKQAGVPVDFLVRVKGKTGMLIKYGPGSLTTRHKPVLALARLVSADIVPVVVVTNGEDAEILDTASENVIARGIANIPDRAGLAGIIAGHQWTPVSQKKREMAARIVYCYEVDGACPCDTTVCRVIA